MPIPAGQTFHWYSVWFVMFMFAMCMICKICNAYDLDAQAYCLYPKIYNYNYKKFLVRWHTCCIHRISCGLTFHVIINETKRTYTIRKCCWQSTSYISPYCDPWDELYMEVVYSTLYIYIFVLHALIHETDRIWKCCNLRHVFLHEMIH